MKDETRPAPGKSAETPTTRRPRFLDEREAPRKPLGRLRTDEEASLAAEIEKLRG